MTKMRYGFSFLISSLVYFILGLLFVSLLERSVLLKKPQQSVIKIAVITPPQPKVIPEKIVAPSIPVPIPPVVIPPKKIEKPKPEPKKIVKKIIKKPKPKKIVKKTAPKAKKVVKKITPKPVTKSKAPVKATPQPVYHQAPAPIQSVQAPRRAQAVPQTVVAPKVNKSAEKKAFLQQVRSKIIANKKYSKIALRRHIEGSVKVKFDISANGSVSNIRFISGKPLLQKSVRDAINKSFPIPIPSTLKNELPMHNISVTVNFKIN